MKKIVAIFLILLSASVAMGQVNGSSSFKLFDIDEKLADKIKKAKSNSDFNGLSDECFWFVSDSLDGADYIPGPNIRSFYDTLTILGDIVCDCMMKNDTAVIQGGIAYEGGIGFDVRITNQSFNGHIWVAGGSYKIDSTTGFQNEVVLKSTYQSLRIQDRKAVAPGKILVGEFYMESERFISKDESTPNKYYMKILFSCKLDEHISF